MLLASSGVVTAAASDDSKMDEPEDRAPAAAVIELQDEPVRRSLHSHTDLQAEAPTVFTLVYPLPSPWL